MLYLLIPICALGHLAMHVAVVNRIHSTGLPRWLLKLGDAVWYLLMAGIPIAMANWYLQHTVTGRSPSLDDPRTRLVGCYLVVCCLAAVWAIVDRIDRKLNIRTTPRLVANHTQHLSLPQQLGHRPVGTALTGILSRLPGNEILQLSIHEKTLVASRLAKPLDGLRITHLSDLHLTGQLSQSFYEEIVRQANAWPADIVAITGDIVEKAACLDWIEPTLGRLQARYGVFFVLGNHELRIKNEPLVRRTLTAAGLIDLGGHSLTISHQDAPIELGGNELPWFSPAANFPDRPFVDGGQRPFRILLTHSPDQLAWARRHDCDLMLAGHTHGGQVQFPVVGPILSPSRHGSRFASGTFYYQPTLMHVSRGLAGTRPLRLNCPPELARLVLRASHS